MSCSVTASTKAARRAATLRAKGLPGPPWLPGAKRPLAWRPSADGVGWVAACALMVQAPEREVRGRMAPGKGTVWLCTHLYYQAAAENGRGAWHRGGLTGIRASILVRDMLTGARNRLTGARNILTGKVIC